MRKEPGQISEPLDFRHMLTVKRDSNQNTPPGSPATVQRLRVARKYLYKYVEVEIIDSHMHSHFMPNPNIMT